MNSIKKYSAKKAYSTQETVDTYDEKRFASRAGRIFDAVEKGIVLSAAPSAERRLLALDVGTGTGRFAIEMAKSGLHVTACDVSKPMLDEVRKKVSALGLEERVRVTEGDVYHLPFADNSFDYVTCIRVLNNLGTERYQKEGLLELARVCTGGGTILFDFVNQYSLGWLDRDGRSSLLSIGRVRKLVGGIPGISIFKIKGRRILSQTAFNISPDFLLGFLEMIDRVFSKLLPFLCVRIYVVLRKSV